MIRIYFNNETYRIKKETAKYFDISDKHECESITELMEILQHDNNILV